LIVATTRNEHEAHFQSLSRQARAARLGMWAFLGSELMLFAGLFGLYAAYRVSHPESFAFGIEHNNKTLGSLNTAILLCSSYSMAMSIHFLRENRRRASLMSLGVTLLLASVFLLFKGIEYGEHFSEGFFAGWVREASAPAGTPLFFALYFGMTGLHALHVIGGMAIIAYMGWRIYRGSLTPTFHHPHELAGLYWHLVDLFWIFLWPLFYLTKG
jgi:cytochrome c oxidase subunit 3